MRIRDLIDELECFDDNDEVVIQSCNSSYVDSIRLLTTKEMRAHWGKDRTVVVIVGNNQEGMVD